MVTKRLTEREQLNLVAAEYRLRGFDVYLEYQIGEVVTDMLAVNRELNKVVVVEFVNRASNRDGLTAKISRLKEAFRDSAENIEVDFRFLFDPDAPERRVITLAEQSISNKGKNLIADILSSRLPSPKMAASPEAQLVNLWVSLSKLINAFFHAFAPKHSATAVLDKYNILLSRFRFVAAEDEDDGKNLPGIFQLKEKVEIAMQGGYVGPDDVKFMREHLASLRKQMKRFRRKGKEVLST